MLRNAANIATPVWIWPATTQPRVDLFRLRKATLYADIIEAGEIPAEAVDGFAAGQWAALSVIAKGRPPSSETCALIRKLLREREAWRERLQNRSVRKQGGHHAS
jgi:hypothetical protein